MASMTYASFDFVFLIAHHPQLEAFVNMVSLPKETLD